MQTNFSPLNDPREIYEDEVILCFRGSSFIGTYSPSDKELKKLGGKNYTNEVLLDKNIKKFFVPYAYQFGHFLTETLSAIVLNLERDKKEIRETTLIIPPTGPREKNNKIGAIQVVSYISNHLLSIGKPMEKIPDIGTDDEVTLVKVANLELQPVVSFNSWSVKKVRDFCRSLPEISLQGDKRLYLSREKTRDTIHVMFSELSLTRENPNHFPPNYPRVSNEPELVEYLTKDFRFPVEKVIPEEIEFFYDQIKLFSETRLVISPTSSGLFNMLFMPEGSTVIELVTPLTTVNRTEFGEMKYDTSYHNQYSLLSFICGINYIGLPHNRDVKQIIDKLDKYMF